MASQRLMANQLLTANQPMVNQHTGSLLMDTMHHLQAMGDKEDTAAVRDITNNHKEVAAVL
jgi:hypothetical protein